MSAMRAKMPARQRREAEQQWLTELLFKSAGDAAEKFSEEAGDDSDADRFYMLAAHDIFGQMISAHGGAYCHHMGNGASELTFVGKWVRGALDEIKKFSRAPEEEGYLKVRLMRRLAEEGIRHVRIAYGNLQFSKERTLYDGHKGSDEVDIPVPHEEALACAGEEHF